MSWVDEHFGFIGSSTLADRIRPAWCYHRVTSDEMGAQQSYVVAPDDCLHGHTAMSGEFFLPGVFQPFHCLHDLYDQHTGPIFLPPLALHRVTEDGLLHRVTEDGVIHRITEGRLQSTIASRRCTHLTFSTDVWFSPPTPPDIFEADTYYWATPQRHAGRLREIADNSLHDFNPIADAGPPASQWRVRYIRDFYKDQPPGRDLSVYQDNHDNEPLYNFVAFRIASDSAWSTLISEQDYNTNTEFAVCLVLTIPGGIDTEMRYLWGALGRPNVWAGRRGDQLFFRAGDGAEMSVGIEPGRHRVVFESTAIEMTIWIDNQFAGTGPAGTENIFGRFLWHSGRDASGIENSWLSESSEIVIVNRATTADERTILDNYFFEEWWPGEEKQIRSDNCFHAHHAQRNTMGAIGQVGMVLAQDCWHGHTADQITVNIPFGDDCWHSHRSERCLMTLESAEAVDDLAPWYPAGFATLTALRQENELEGIVDSPQFTCSFWLRPPGGCVISLMRNDARPALEIQMGSSMCQVIAHNDTDTILSWSTNFGPFIDGQYAHVMIGADLTIPEVKVVVDGVLITPMSEVTAPSEDIVFTSSYQTDIGTSQRYVGGGVFEPFSSNALLGSLAQFWFADGVYLDPETEHGLFRANAGVPIDLGNNGEIPTGVPPRIYLTGMPTQWRLNRGDGGEFTLDGQLVGGTVPVSPYPLQIEILPDDTRHLTFSHQTIYVVIP